MKYSYAVLATAGLVAAQNPEDFFPACAIQCIADAAAQVTDCGDDFACRCTPENQGAISSAATQCVISACGIAVAAGEVLPASEAFCDAVAAGGDGDDDDDDDDQTTTPVETPVQTTPAETTTPIMETTTTEGTDTVQPTPTANETAVPTGTPPAEVDAAGIVAPVGSLFVVVLGALVAF